jgi:hypothetical protein
MSYGTIKVDTITFTDNSVDKSVSLSGLIQNPTFTGNITVTGTISGDVIRGGTTVSGATVTGTTANFVSGVFTTQISGATVTGTTASFTSGVFTNISGTAATITSGIIASGTAAAPSLAILADLDTGLFSPGANELAVATNGTGRLFVDASGDVGVGTSSPVDKLSLEVGAGNSGLSVYFSGTEVASLRNDNGNATLNANNANLKFATGNNERLRITSAGLVGIGTNSPGQLLDVAGVARFGVNATKLTTYSDSTYAGFFNGSSLASNESIYMGAGGTFFYNNGSPSVTIDSTGRVGIGTTTPQDALHIAVASAVLRLEDTDTNCISTIQGTAAGLVLSADATNSTASSFLGLSVDGTERARIDSSGRLLVGTSTSTNNIRLDEKLAVVSVGGISGASFTTYESGTADQPSIIDLQRSRGSSDGSLTVVQSGDTIGSIIFRGSDGSAFQNAARIDAYVDGTPGANDMPGRLVLSTTADGASSPTERLRITSAGLVGIGTSSPEGKLTVAGTAAEPPSSGTTANSLLQLKSDVNTELNIGLHTVTGNYGAYIQASDNNLAVSYGLHLQPRGGNVGIGTTSASTILHVASTAPYIRIQDTDSSTGVTAQGGFEMYDNDGDRLFYLANESSSSSDVSLFNIAGGALKFGTSGSERGQFDSSGRLLVGTSTARAFNTHNGSLQIDGDNYSESTVAIIANSNDADGAYLAFAKQRSGSSGGNTVVQNNDIIGELRFNAGDGTDCDSLAGLITCRVDGTPGNNDMPGRLVFSTTADGASSPTERMRITSDGYLRASNTGSYPSPASSNCHHLASSNNNYTVDVYNSNGSFNATVLQISADRNTSNSTYNLIRASRIGTTDVFYVRDSGNVQNVNNSYTGTSDAKLKENIINATSQWDDIKALRVCKFNFKEDTGFSTHTQIGLIAQEVEVVSPGLVDEAIDRDAEGNDLGTVTKSVNYSVLYMKAVKALQEAIGRIETLEGMVAVNNITIDEQQHQLSTLEARLTALETP